MVKAKVWKIQKYFEGEPQASDLDFVEEEFPELKDGEMLIEALFLSVDPYMRFFNKDRGTIGNAAFGEQIARVIESKNKDFPVGVIVRTHAGWRSHSIISQPTRKMPELGDLPLSTALGVMGMPGMTAYFGFLEICKPKEGETVLVNGAAGAVGSIVAQIAKIKGCKVICFAGTEDKCQWLRDLGIEHVYNYKKVQLTDALNEAAPDGVDCFFDNVGGEFATTVIERMKPFGRMSVCGGISTYNEVEKPRGILPFGAMIRNKLLLQGFIVGQFLDRWPEGEKQMLEWIQQGKVKYKETVIEGIENMYKAFLGLFKGSNMGKMIVKC